MMSSWWLATGSLLVATTLIAVPAEAQTANGSPTAPAPPGLVGTPRPISRTAPTAGVRGKAPAGTVQQQLPKPSAADRAEQRKLERDLKICIGC